MNSRIRGYIIHSGVVALLFSLVVIATGSALKFRSESPNPPSAAPGRVANMNGATTLTFGQRVAYQRAIEDVYWRHRIWPKENGSPKPALDTVISQAQIEQKVTDYIRKSQALEDYWQRALTTEQLQAEMDRMAQQTKQPDVLRELFEALGNDPFVIAECLARPTLAERLLPHSIFEQSEQTSQTDSQIRSWYGELYPPHNIGFARRMH